MVVKIIVQGSVHRYMWGHEISCPNHVKFIQWSNVWECLLTLLFPTGTKAHLIKHVIQWVPKFYPAAPVNTWLIPYISNKEGQLLEKVIGHRQRSKGFLSVSPSCNLKNQICRRIFKENILDIWNLPTIDTFTFLKIKENYGFEAFHLQWIVHWFTLMLRLNILISYIRSYLWPLIIHFSLSLTVNALIFTKHFILCSNHWGTSELN